MKVFISWSGSGGAIAQELSEWMRRLLHPAEFFVSKGGISPGQKWREVISQELSDSDIGVVCLTREALTAPWVHFEAGALAKDVKTAKLIAIRFGVAERDIQGPLEEFNNVDFDKEGLCSVVQTLNGSLVKPHRNEDLQANFEDRWPHLKKRIGEIRNAVPMTKNVPREVPDILEELVSRTRRLERELLVEREARLQHQAVPPEMRRDLDEMGSRLAHFRAERERAFDEEFPNKASWIKEQDAQIESLATRIRTFERVLLEVCSVESKLSAEHDG